MSAAFEINIVYQGMNEFFKLLNVIKFNNLKYSIDSIEMIDDWQYNNYQILKTNKLKEINCLINQGKILIIKGVLKKIYNFGVSFSLLKQNIFDINFWISTERFKVLDCDYITNKNVMLYNIFTKQIIDIINHNSLIICAIGSELYWESSDDVEKMINSSKNVCEYIFSNEKDYNLLEEYSKKVLNKYSIYRLYEKKLYYYIKNKIGWMKNKAYEGRNEFKQSVYV